jgi:hypothetical protein
MRIEEITKQGLSKASDLELKRLRYKLAKFWDNHFKNNDNRIVGVFKRSDFIAKYRLLLKEIESSKRSLQHSTCDIDRQAFKQTMQAKSDGVDLAMLDEVLLVQNCVLVDESFSKADKLRFTIRMDEPNDIVKSAMEERVLEIIRPQFDKVCEFVYDKDFNGDCVPLFHQVLKPVSKVEKIKVKNEAKEVEKNLELVPIEKSDEQIVYGIVYEPDTKDAQGDQASAEEIRKAAYDFMENARAFKVMHKGKKVKVKILENYIAPVDFTIAKRNVKKGSWVLVTRVLDKKLWQEIKAGNLTGYSMAGYANVN